MGHIAPKEKVTRALEDAEIVLQQGYSGEALQVYYLRVIALAFVAMLESSSAPEKEKYDSPMNIVTFMGLNTKQMESAINYAYVWGWKKEENA